MKQATLQSFAMKSLFVAMLFNGCKLASETEIIEKSLLAETDVPIALSPNTDYEVHIVIENSMLVVYINNEVALSTRIYKATNTHWGIFSDNSNASFKNITVSQP